MNVDALRETTWLTWVMYHVFLTLDSWRFEHEGIKNIFVLFTNVEQDFAWPKSIMLRKDGGNKASYGSCFGHLIVGSSVSSKRYRCRIVEVSEKAESSFKAPNIDGSCSTGTGGRDWKMA